MTNLLLFFFFIVFLLANVGCRSLPEPDMKPLQTHVSVLTYNVNYGTRDRDSVIEFIIKSDADIVCLQETGPDWCSTLDARFAERYPQRLFHAQPGPGGIAILSRFKFLDTAYLPPVKGWFPALCAKIDSPLGPALVLNLHLRPSLSDEGSATLSAYYQVPKIRVADVSAYLNEIPKGLPLIVCGDFNEGDGGAAVAWLRERGLEDSLSRYDASSPTWRWRLGPIPLSARFDHILFAPELDCTGARVTEAGPSDHLPVLAVFIKK